MEAAADRFGALADDFHDLAEQLRGEKLASDPSANLKAAKAAFDQVAARLAAGDVSALDDLKGVAQDFSAASKGGAKTAAEDARNQAAIRRSLIEAESLARQQVDAAHAELDALQKLAEMGGLEVELQQQAVDALRELLGAVADLASVQAQADEALRNLVIDAVGQTAVTPAGPDLAAIDAAAIDAAALALVATPMVDVMSPGTINEPIDYGELLTTLQAVAVNTGQATRLFRRWDGDGLPEARDYA
jgi:hypothetical protein